MYVQRTAYLETIRERLRGNPIVSLVGPHQAGKTTLARMLAEESAEAVHFFDLESPADLARLANPKLVPSRRRGLVILDDPPRRARIPARRIDHRHGPAASRRCPAIGWRTGLSNPALNALLCFCS